MERRRRIVIVALSIGLAAGMAAAADPPNLALTGTATQSSEGWGGAPGRAIDGNTSGVWGNNSTTHTAPGDAAPWWQVDLGQVTTLTHIIIWGRTDCCLDRLTKLKVSVLDDGAAEVWSKVFYDDCTYPNPASFSIVLPKGTEGKIVRIDHLAGCASALFLSLAEVQVFDWTGYCADIRVQPAGARTGEGGKATFSVQAVGEPPLHYKWFDGDDEIPDSDSPTLTIDPATKDDAGTYKVVVSNAVCPEGVESEKAELVVKSKNIARAGTAWQSSEGWGGSPGRAIDGNTDGNWGSGSTTHTADGDIAPTWEVALPVEATIDGIAMWGRVDCCTPRLSNFRVTVFDSARQTTFSEVFFADGVSYPPAGVPFDIDVPAGTKARYVRVEILAPTRYDPPAATERLLSLAEVEIYGESPPPPPDPNIARTGTASQSTTNGGFTANLAINGNYGDFTHTLGTDAASTWDLNLGAMTDIGEIVLYNRTSCCGSRLRDITVSVLNDVGDPVYTSDLLNPENTGYAYPNGPATITIDIVEEVGGIVQGQIVRVTRAPDPDLSGTGGQGNPDEANVLSLGEVEVFATACPTDGDTHCAGLTLVGPKEGQPGIYRLVGVGADDSDDRPQYTFTVDDGVNPVSVVGPRLGNFAFFALTETDWALSVAADDGARCADVTDDATCESPFAPVPHPDNIAVLGVATQSSIGWDGVPERAIDGNTNGLYGSGSVSHTADGDPSPWWEVDLQDLYPLDRIVIWSRLDCCWNRLVNFRVAVLDDVRDVVFEENLFEDGKGWVYTLTEGIEIKLPKDTEGQFVRIESLGPEPRGTRFITLAEVEVYKADIGPIFKRGYVNDDVTLDLGDAISILNYMFADGAEPPCVKAADMDDEQGLTIGDAIYLLGFIFADGPEPIAPFAECGVDPTPDDGLTCERSPVCPQ